MATFQKRTVPISVIIPTAFYRDDSGHALCEAAILSLRNHLGQVERDELIVVTGEEDDDGLLNSVSRSVGFEIRRVVVTGDFNFSRRANIGFLASSNETILLMNDDVVLGDNSIVNQMSGLLDFPNVGLVGGLLLYPNLEIQHAGHVYARERMSHAHLGRRRVDAPMFELLVDREVSGVTGALVLQKREVWESVGGFCESLPLNFNDVDYCLKVSMLGYSIIQANSVLAIHAESMTREARVESWEVDIIRNRWEFWTSRLHDPFTSEWR